MRIVHALLLSLALYLPTAAYPKGGHSGSSYATSSHSAPSHSSGGGDAIGCLRACRSWPLWAASGYPVTSPAGQSPLHVAAFPVRGSGQFGAASVERE